MPLNVLVVDDIAESRRALCALVRELGHDAVGVDSGAGALQRLEQHLPDLLLLDLWMPGMDGFEVTRRLREQVTDRWLPVVVTSSLEGVEPFTHALDHGADDYLQRPVDARLLDAKLRHYERVLALQGRLTALAQRQQGMLDNILDAVLTLDAAGCVREFNLAAQSLADRHGQPIGEGAASADVFGVAWPQLLDCRECTLHRADGAAFPAEIGLSEWRDQGQPHYTLVLRDLTERRQIDRMKDEFLATVSHELRTPLTSIIGALGLLAGGAAGALPPDAAPLAEVARRNGERLSRLIDDILDITKLESDRLVLHLRPLSPASLLREAVAANDGYAQGAQVRLLLEGAGPDDAPLPEVRLDPDRFGQVMANLISNAIKHSPPGETVRIGVQADDAGLRVTVRDRGPGIDPRFRARMFEKFSQADGSDRRAQGGTGLGLYITRLLVERMGGRIQADPVEGRGAAFTLRLPLAAHGTDRPAPLVLHVEADGELRSRVARWLAPGYRVSSAATLDEAAAAQAGASVLIGNPQSQGAADAFCADLRRLAAGRPALLFGDSVDAGFCERMALPWLSAAHSDAQALRHWVATALGRGATVDA